MTDYGRRIVVDQEFEAALGEVTHAIRQEGMEIIARIDVRDHFWRDVALDFRRYFLLEAWSPAPALAALRQNLDVGAILPTTFGVYELADGETGVVAREPLWPLSENLEWRRRNPTLAALADAETDRVARVFAALQHRGAPRGRSAVPAA